MRTETHTGKWHIRCLLLCMMLALSSCTGSGVQDGGSSDSSAQAETGQASTTANESGTDDATPDAGQTFSGDTITIEELKEKYKGQETIEIQPFYNVEQKTEFLFHFNSDVEPLSAVTVHTDRKCELNSRVPDQKNTGYYGEDGGTDVVVTPPMFPLLRDQGDADSFEFDTWGRAPVYYLCIRYDMESEEVRLLEKPVVIPFTIRSEVSVPTLYPQINEDGVLTLRWNAVEEAVEYRLYYDFSMEFHQSNNEGSQFAWDTDEAIYLTRPECGYCECSPTLMKSFPADTLEAVDLSREGFENTGGYGDNTLSQNRMADYSYYLTAVDKDGNESFFSVPVDGWAYASRLPLSIDNECAQRQYWPTGAPVEIENLPTEMGVVMMDGTTAYYPVRYELEEVDESGYGRGFYTAYIEGTVLRRTRIPVHSESGHYEETIASPYQISGGRSEVENEIDAVVPNTIETIPDADSSDFREVYLNGIDMSDRTRIPYDPDEMVERSHGEYQRMLQGGAYGEWTPPEFTKYLRTDMKGKELSTEPVETDFAAFFESDEYRKLTGNGAASLVYDQIMSTMEHIKQAQTETVPLSDCPVFARNAAEEYLALMMIAGVEEISVRAFPELQDPQVLTDYAYKTIFQNPYVISVERMRYDARKQALKLWYAFDEPDKMQKQEEIRSAVESIVEETITENMTETEKLKALWDYLEEHTEYDMDALEAAEKSNFRKVRGFDDSFNAYGILVNKKGVCQSYALAYKLLCDAAGLECITLTGYLNRNLPHAWNAVRLDGTWYWVDVTNHKKTTGIPYMMFLTSSDMAKTAEYVTDDRFEINNRLRSVQDHDDSLDYYVQNGLYAETDEDLIRIVAEQYANRPAGEDAVFVRCKRIPMADEEFVMELAKALLAQGVSEEEMMEIAFGFTGGIFVVGSSF